MSTQVVGMEGLVEQMSHNTFNSSISKLNRSFISVAGAKLNSSIMSKLMKILEPFVELFDMFSPVFEIIGAAVEAFFLPLMEALTPIIKIVGDALKFIIPIAEKLGNLVFLGISIAFQFFYVMVLRPIWFLLKYYFIIMWEVLLMIGRIFCNILIANYNFLIGIWNWCIDAYNWFVRYILFGWLWGFKNVKRVAYAEYIDVVDEERWENIMSNMKQDALDMARDKRELFERIDLAIEEGVL